MVQWAQSFVNWILDIFKRSDDQKEFVVLPRRWVVERTFAWFGRYRRLNKDYKRLIETSETMTLISMIHLCSVGSRRHTTIPKHVLSAIGTISLGRPNQRFTVCVS